MIQTMLLQFFDLLGTTQSNYLNISEDMVDDFVGHGLRDMVQLVRQYNPVKLHHFGVVEEITAQSYDASAVDMDMVLSITRDIVIGATTYNKLVRQVPYALRGSLIDIGSKHYAIKADPGGYFDEADLLTVLPVPTANEKAYLEHINIPADPDVGTNKTIATITNCRFPDSLTRAVLLFAVIQAKLRESGYVRKLGNDHIEAVFGTTVVDSNVFNNELQIVINHGLGYIPVLTILDVNGVEMTASTTHNNPTFTTTTIDFSVAETGTWQISAYTGGGLLASYIAALPTFSAVTSPTLPTAIVVGNLAAAAKNLPTYVAPDFSGVVAPSAPTIGSLTMGNVEALAKALPAYAGMSFAGLTTPTALTNSETGMPTIDALSGVPPAIDTSRIYQALTQAGDLVKVGATATDNISDDADSFLATHDSEMVAEASKAAQAAVGVARGEIEAEIAKWQKFGEETKYAVGSLGAEANAYNAQVNGIINEFQANINKYIADVDKVIKTWIEENKMQIESSATDMKNKVDVYRAEAEADIGAFNAEQTAEVQKWNADIQYWAQQNKKVIDVNVNTNKTQIDIFSAEVEERVQQYRAETEMDINNYRANAEALIAKYREDVVQEIQRNTVAIDKAVSYLKALEARLGLVRTLFSTGATFIAELKELQTEYIRRVTSFCGVVPQTNTQQRR